MRRPGAVRVLETAARPEAAAALASLPLAAGIIDFELIELRPFSAFEVLFPSLAHTREELERTVDLAAAAARSIA